jgi:mono/diheme cytochrome c family protein
MPILATTPNQGGQDLVNPLPVTAQVLGRGRDMFNIHCAVCHDKLGTGKAWLDSTYVVKPADLQSSTLREAPDGFLYWVISNGFGTMPSYAADISQHDRWSIVRYVRSLQRSQHALETDLKK